MTGVSDAKLFLMCRAMVGAARCISRSHRTAPVWKSMFQTTQRWTSDDRVAPLSSPGS